MIPWYWYTAFAIILIAFVSEVLCLIGMMQCRKNKKFLHWQSIITLGYVLVIVTAILWFHGTTLYFIRAGIATSISLSMLALLHIADIIANRRC